MIALFFYGQVDGVIAIAGKVEIVHVGFRTGELHFFYPVARVVFIKIDKIRDVIE